MLSSTAGLRLSATVMHDLYEQMVIEMCELREVDTAKAMMRTAPVSQTQHTQPRSPPHPPTTSAHSTLSRPMRVCLWCSRSYSCDRSSLTATCDSNDSSTSRPSIDMRRIQPAAVGNIGDST